jgi:teichuronic acid biosynthesis glycosyltransferase TuaG
MGGYSSHHLSNPSLERIHKSVTSSSQTRVSIITPAYKSAAFVGEAIRSVQGQDFSDWEMLIVEDGSPDNTAMVVGELASVDPRVKLIRQTNRGPAMARQRALDVAKGRYIAFLDSDDYWLPGKLSHQLAFMHYHGAALSYTRFRRISTEGIQIGHLVAVPERLDYWQLLKNTGIATSTVIVDREMTGPFAMTQTYYDDYVLWLALLKRGFVAHGLQEDLMRYRVVSKSVSRHKLNSAKWVWRTYRDIEGLTLPYATWCFLNYAWHAYRKYASF